MAAVLDRLSNFERKLMEELYNSSDNSAREKLISEYIEGVESSDIGAIPEFEEGLQWLNCQHPLNFETKLKGKLCVLDFFTYCCINCMHILPDLHALEKIHSVSDGLVIVGVHSAKFNNEKDTANILNAMLRYDIRHVVVNDSNASLWYKLGVNCWPTLVLVSPEGKLLLSLVGEGHKQTLQDFVKVALEYYQNKGLISSCDIGVQLAVDALPKTMLSFPGKICHEPQGDKLAVSDTGHHQVLIITREGVIMERIGTGSPGLKDGTFGKAEFNAPQGVTWFGDCVFVADTENHCIRKIDLALGHVTTVAGTGSQGSNKEGGGLGPDQVISSPWDVVVGPPPGVDNWEKEDSVLYIAMAGTHQIWALSLKPCQWLKKSSLEENKCLRLAGSGSEENRNNSYPHKAAFAQPSGITLAAAKPFNCLYIADSESSSIRSVALETGAVKGVAGAERDPMNLFAYGDVDGRGVEAKLQHPLGVCWNPHNNTVIVADSYNHKIKVVNPTEQSCTTFLGTGSPGRYNDEEQVKFNEPGGLCLSPDGQQLYVADTNNNMICVVDMATSKVSELKIVEHPVSHTDGRDRPDGSAKKMKRLTSKHTPVSRMDTVQIGPEQVTVNFSVSLPEGFKLTPDAPSKWQGSLCQGESALSVPDPSNGKFMKDSMNAVAHFTWDNNWGTDGLLRMEALVYFCEEDGPCRMQGVVLEVPIKYTKDEENTAINIHHQCTV